MTHSCPKCNSTKVTGITRIVGYFSKIGNWIENKKEELKYRQKGNYKV
jgi:ribonucleoside-triphosphate reductase (formate)